MSAAAKALAGLYVDVGLPCEIEAGPVGLVVYGPTSATVNAVTKSLARGPRTLGVAVRTSPAAADADEPEATRWWGTVEFDWDAMPSSASACVAGLAPKGAKVTAK